MFRVKPLERLADGANHWLLAISMSAIACGGSVTTVPMARVPGGFTEVGYPPPPAKVEMLPADPGAPCAWQDGYWEWKGNAWEWEAGKWVWPQEGCFFSPPAGVWTTGRGGGTYRYRSGRWYSENGSECPAPAPCKTQPVAIAR